MELDRNCSLLVARNAVILSVAEDPRSAQAQKYRNYRGSSPKSRAQNNGATGFSAGDLRWLLPAPDGAEPPIPLARLSNRLFQTKMLTDRMDDRHARLLALDCKGRTNLIHNLRWRILYMSKQDEAGLILKLYELRREETMRKARDWYFQEFHPQSIDDVNDAMFGEHSGHLRMVVSYWDMAAALVNEGAISLDLFTNTNGEHIGVFSKIEPLLAEIRSAYAPQYAANFEKLIDATPDGRQRTAQARERMKSIREKLAARKAKAAHQA